MQAHCFGAKSTQGSLQVSTLISRFGLLLMHSIAKVLQARHLSTQLTAAVSSFGGKIGRLGENYPPHLRTDENYSPYLHLLKKREGRKFRRRQF